MLSMCDLVITKDIMTELENTGLALLKEIYCIAIHCDAWMVYHSVVMEYIESISIYFKPPYCLILI